MAGSKDRIQAIFWKKYADIGSKTLTSCMSEREKEKTAFKGRLCQLLDFGIGKRVGHRGGRFLWHLRDSSELLVRWRICSAGAPDQSEKVDAIARFKAVHKGNRPFANLNK